jgi:hypothetical protein
MADEGLRALFFLLFFSASSSSSEFSLSLVLQGYTFTGFMSNELYQDCVRLSFGSCLVNQKALEVWFNQGLQFAPSSGGCIPLNPNAAQSVYFQQHENGMPRDEYVIIIFLLE